MNELKRYPLVTVGGLIFAEDGTILFVKAPKWSGLYTLPGGKVELGETLAEAFEREIFEETALKVTHVRFALTQDSLFNEEYFPKNHFVMHDYLAQLAPGFKKEDVILNDEGVSYRWMTINEARKEKLNKEAYVLLDWYERNYQVKSLVGFSRLEIECIIGNNLEERTIPQKIYVSLKMNVECKETDNLGDTVDYDEAARLFESAAKETKFKLIETYALHMKNLLMKKYSLLKGIQINVYKPEALSHAEAAFIEIKEGFI